MTVGVLVRAAHGKQRCQAGCVVHFLNSGKKIHPVKEMGFALSEENTFCVSLDSRWPATQERLQRHEIHCARWPAYLPHELAEEFAPH